MSSLTEMLLATPTAPIIEAPVKPSQVKLQKQKDAIKYFEDQWIKSGTLNIHEAITFKGKGVALKSEWPNVIVRKGTLAPQVAAWLRMIKKWSLLNSYTSYLIGTPLTDIPFNSLDFLVPSKWYNQSDECKKYTIQTINDNGAEPGAYISGKMLTKHAALISIPDEYGKVIIHAHVGSLWTWKYVPSLWVDDEGLNKEKLDACSDWKVLATYINSFGTFSKNGVDQGTVCRIVRAISRNQAEKKLKKMIKDFQESNS